jgi:hypothetical protein
VPGYEYDVFVSYSRHGSAPKWLKNHFYPKVEDCLTDHMTSSPKIFMDKAMERAVDWPAALEKALHRSKIMIAVLTPRYFQSAWCMAELRSMRARERKLGLASPERPQGLIYPILYSDSENFPEEEGLRRSWWDFKKLSMPEPVFQESRDWPLFHNTVLELARDLSELVSQVPPWQPDWPDIERPDPVLMPSPPIPRFGL